MASLGARLLEGTIDKKVNDFFQNIQRKLEGGGAPSHPERDQGAG